MSTQPEPRYFVADDGGGSIALWRNRPDEPNRPDPVLYQHSTDPGVWDAAVAALVRRDTDTQQKSSPKRITGRELIAEIERHPSWLDLPVHVLVMDDGDDGGFLNTIEIDRFEVDEPDVISLVSERPQSVESVAGTPGGGER